MDLVKVLSSKGGKHNAREAIERLYRAPLKEEMAETEN